MPLLVSKIKDLKDFPSPDKLRSELEKQTGLSVEIKVNEGKDFHKINPENYSDLNFPTNSFLDYKIIFLVPDKRVVSTDVSCRVFKDSIRVMYIAGGGWLDNKYSNYYELATIFALKTVTGATRYDYHPENYGHLKWTEWCELNGGPVPPLWKRILSQILGWFMALLMFTFILGMWAIVILVVVFILRLILLPLR